MDIYSFIRLFGGLALFLYGMTIMANSLEHLAGGKLEDTLRKFTSNIILSILFGAIVTALIQSSSATTVIVVGLINAKFLNLKQGIGVIMGANIGTTVTAQIIRLSTLDSDTFILKFLNTDNLSSLLAIVGIFFFILSKTTRRKNLGIALVGFGVLFVGLEVMENAVYPLRGAPALSNLFATFTNPLLGILIGAIVTAVVQSSSASVGMLQALSSTGAITYASAIPIILGQNIGTCITAMLASIGAKKNAKRAAMVHLYFNIIGSLVFIAAIYIFQYTVGFAFWNDTVDAGGIANFHTIFNVAVTALFLPFVGMLEKLARATIK